MTQRKAKFQPPQCDPNVVVFDARSRKGSRAARHSVEKVWLSMCLGSVVSMTFVLAAKQLF